MPEPIAIVYDGDCAFCRRSLRVLGHLDGRGAMHVYESQAAELVAAKFPMLAGADFDNAMFAVTSEGRVFRGYFAFKELLRRLPAAWPLLLLCYLPGASVVGPRIYAWVARNRTRLGCGSEVCDRPAPPSTSPRDSTRTR